MKVILSRKGFDSEYGGMPSPILPDNTMLSFPIPDETGNLSYDQLYINGKAYSELLKELRPKAYDMLNEKYRLRCHLDPDIRKDAVCERAAKWIPVFGQCDAAEGHLRNMGVDIGDIFLYFGTFRKTEYTPEHGLRFIPGSPELHVIFGYFQIGKRIIKQDEINTLCNWHPHANRDDCINNTVYIPTDKLSCCPEISGSGVLNFDEKLVLTKENCSKSKWVLPEFLRETTISYHPNGFKDEYFQSAGKGQEFVIGEHSKLEDWCLGLLCR